MTKLRTVFWSWQSDTSPRETRDLIRDALKIALDRISASYEEAERPELDHDTKGVPGTPEIVATILSKIDAAAAFVADVTPVAVSKANKQIANPNVLIELGYAKKSLGPSRVILVWNTAIQHSRPEDLPFDLRHRRGPLTYCLPIGASRKDLREARENLTGRFVEALTDVLSSLPTEPVPEPAWHANEAKQPAIWKGNDVGLPVNHGSDEVADIGVEGSSMGFARLIPSEWEVRENALRILEHSTQHPIPLGRYGGLSWGPTTGGFLVFRHNESVEESGLTTTATRWFRATGELWGVDGQFIRDHNDSSYYSELYAAERWLAWLKHSVTVCRITGGRPPFKIWLGIEGLRGAHWTRSSYGGSVPQGLEESMKYKFELANEDDTIIRTHLRHALNEVRDAFGLTRLSQEDFEGLAQKSLG